MARAGVLAIKIVGDSKPLSKSLGSSVKKIGKFAAAAAAAGAAAAVAFGVKALTSAVELNETLSKTEQVFGDASDKVTGFADKMADAFGLPKQEMLDAASNIGLVAKASGLSEDAAADMSTEMAQLAADASSFFNVPLPDALEKIRSGLVGEAEPLRSFGVLLSAAAVEEKAVAEGIAEAGEELTEQQKVMARSMIITEQMGDANGDLERTQGSLANRWRKLQGRMQNFAAEAGMKLIPVVTKVWDWFDNKLMPAVSGLGSLISSFVKGDLQGAHDAFKKIPVPLHGFAQGLWDFMGLLRDDVIPAVKDFWQVHGPAIIGAMKTAASVVKTVFKKAFDTVVGTFKFVNRNSEVMIPLLGGILSGFLAFKAVIGVIKAIAAAKKAWVAVQAALNVVMSLNPIGLVVAAIVGLIAIVVIAYQRSETFRRIVNGAFDKVKQAAFLLAAAAVKAFRTLLNFWLSTAEKIVGGAAKAFGWVPGLGDKLKGAHRAIKGFRETVNRELGKVERNLTVRAKTVGVSGVLANLRGIQREVVRTQSAGITVATSGGRGRLTQFHTGGVVARGGVAEVAEKERVLTADQNRNLEQIASGRGGGVKTEVNINFPGGMLLGGPDELRRAVQEALREFERRSGRTALAGFGG